MMAPGAQEVAWVVVEMDGGGLANGRPLYLGTALQSTLAEWGRVHAKLQAGYGDGSSSLPFRGRNGNGAAARDWKWAALVLADESRCAAAREVARLRMRDNAAGTANGRRRQRGRRSGADRPGMSRVARRASAARFRFEQHHHQHLTAHQRGRRPAWSGSRDGCHCARPARQCSTERQQQQSCRRALAPACCAARACGVVVRDGGRRRGQCPQSPSELVAGPREPPAKRRRAVALESPLAATALLQARINTRHAHGVRPPPVLAEPWHPQRSVARCEPCASAHPKFTKPQSVKGQGSIVPN